DRTVLVGHRLVAAGAIDDREPTMAERYPRAEQETVAVGTPMTQSRRHGAERRADARIEIAVQAHDATDAAHGRKRSFSFSRPDLDPVDGRHLTGSKDIRSISQSKGVATFERVIRGLHAGL